MKKLEKPEVNMLVGRKRLEWVAYNLHLSSHFKMQYLKRTDAKVKLKDRVLNSPLFWKTYNDNICIALSSYEYMVVDPNYKYKDKIVPVGVTFVNLKETGGTVVDKFLITYKDFSKEF